mgnify:CR=1 FL=1
MLKKFLIYTILITSFIIFFYTIYKSEIIFDGERREFYVTYVILSIAGIILGWLLKYLKTNHFTFIIICLFAIIISFYTFEFYVSYLVNKNLSDLNVQKKVELYKKEYGKEYDSRSIYEYYLSQIKTKKNIKIDTSPANLLKYKDSKLFPLSGYSNSEIILCNEYGYFNHIFTDRYGFNNPDNLWDMKKIDYVLIGDSTIEGYCQDKQNTIAEYLRKFSNKSILNLGQGAAGTLQEYAILLEYIPENVESIIWFIADNAIIDLEKELKHPILYNYLIKNNAFQELKTKQLEVENFYRKIFTLEEQKQKKMKFIRFLKLDYLRTYMHTILNTKINNQIIYKDNDEENFLQFKKIMENVKKFCESNDIDLNIVYLPSYRYFNNNVYKNKHYGPIKDILKDLEMNLIDINELVLKKESNVYDLWPFGLYGHYNNNGSDKISKAIFKFVMK